MSTDCKNQEYCYILDYSDASICEIELTKEDNKLEAEELLDKYGCNPNVCNWMFTTIKIDNIIKLRLNE